MKHKGFHRIGCKCLNLQLELLANPKKRSEFICHILNEVLTRLFGQLHSKSSFPCTVSIHYNYKLFYSAVGMYDAPEFDGNQNSTGGTKMKKLFSTLVAIVFISSMLANTASAGDRSGGISPFWIPVAILSTLAAVTIAQPAPVAYERRVSYEPRRTVVREEPRYFRHEHYYENTRIHETPQHRYYR